MARILIVDDDVEGTKLLETLLGLEGHTPLRLENWKDPVDDVAKQRPDILIMDVYLRTRDGFELLTELRSHPDTGIAQTPVLMMSAEDFQARCRTAGANGFLPKPFNLPSLISAIRTIEEESVNTHTPPR